MLEESLLNPSSESCGCQDSLLTVLYASLPYSLDIRSSLLDNMEIMRTAHAAFSGLARGWAGSTPQTTC